VSTPADRPARWRRWSRRLGLAAFAGGALVGGTIAWLLLSDAGRDTALARLTDALPEGALRWQRAEGPLRGPLVLHDVVYAHDGVELRAGRLMVDFDVLPVLGRRLQLDALELDDVVLVLPPADDAPFEAPAWPTLLPRIPMPVDLRSARVAVRGFELRRAPDAAPPAGDGDAAAAPLLELDQLDALGLHLVDDGLSLSSLAAAGPLGRASLQGDYRPAHGYRSALHGTFARDGAEGQPALEVTFALRGDARAMAFDLRGQAPGAIALQAQVARKGDGHDWSLSLDADGVSPAAWGDADGAPVSARLQLDGHEGEAVASGTFRQGDLQLALGESMLSLAGDVLRVDPLQLETPQGTITLRGDAHLDDRLPFDLQVASDRLRFTPAEPGAPAVEARTTLRLHGVADDWRLDGEARLAREGSAASLALSGRGDRAGLRLDTLQARTPGGSLEGQADLRWRAPASARLQARLQALDPGYFLPDYPGRVDGRLTLEAGQDERGAWTGELRLDDLHGQLRDRALQARAQARWSGGSGEGDAAMRLGESQLAITGRFGEQLDLRATLSPLRLDDLLPAMAGRLHGELALRGPRTAPAVVADLHGEALAVAGFDADAVDLVADLPATGNDGQLRLGLTGARVAGQPVSLLLLQGRGSQANLALEARATGDAGTLELAGELGRDRDDWRGRLDRLAFAPGTGPTLTLDQAARFRVGGQTLVLDPACLRVGDGQGRLCLAATGNTLSLDGEGLPLALAQPWWPQDEALPTALDGALSLQARLQREAGGWRGEARATSPAGALRLDEGSARELIAYRDLLLNLTLAPDALRGDLSAALPANGRVAARFDVGLAEAAALAGELDIDARELAFLELLSQDLAAPTGRLQGRLTLGGTTAAPVLAGNARLAGFAAELPALGLKLSEGEFELDGQPDGITRLSGSLRSGEGRLRLDGSLDLGDPDSPLQLTLGGERVTFASTPELYVVATPSLTLRQAKGRLEVRGQVGVPEARVDLERLDAGATTSSDVVVLDPRDPVAGPALPLDLDLRVTLGEDVRLKGFGLDGGMTGTLAFRQRPGRATTATGTLDVTGAYRAYGQALDIRRARLSYAGSAVDDPALDIRAERAFEEVTVGVRVRGTARRPETTITSQPAMETSEALSWLVFGRPLSRTSGAEGQQLDAAAMALGAGGNLVAQQIGARLGLDEAGISDSRNLGGAALTVGKYLSPRLFISYGVSLVGTGQVVTLKYLLTRGFDVSVESGNENAASLNWRTER